MSIAIYYHQQSLDVRQDNSTLKSYKRDLSNTVVLSGISLQLVCSFIGLCVLVGYKRQLNIDRTGEHPLKLIYQVLRYAWNHTCPENRSAFTYWEEDIPPRIDLGKNKYGGPFTTEEVEDTKSFFRTILLLFSLIGFHLPGQGFSQLSQLARGQCPTLLVLILAGDPTNITLIMIIIGIPFYQLVLVRCCKKIPKHNMLKQVGLGMLCCFLKEIARIIIHATMTREKPFRQADTNPIVSCYLITMNNNHTLPVYDDTCKINNIPFLLMIIPNVLQGLSYLLVFMTILEFICAQAPLRLKGLLIAIWYALLAICYLPVALLINEMTTWEVVHEVKAFLVFLSLMLYLCVSGRYRYRLRDEVVQEQFLVEEIYERELAHQADLKQKRVMKRANNRDYGSMNK